MPTCMPQEQMCKARRILGADGEAQACRVQGKGALGIQELPYPKIRNTPSTAGNSMTGFERPSPEPLLKKEASPAVLGGRKFWKYSGAFKCLEL